MLGTKQNMTVRFNTTGKRTPVTEIKADENIVLAIKEGKAQLGFGRKKKAKKTENAYVKVAGFSPRRVKEFTLSAESPQIKVGSQINVSVFAAGDLVKVSGVTKGKGFAGSVKRWGFSGGPKTHGQSDRHRAPGSIGAGTTPGRVYRGKKMPGHMGSANQTIINLEIVEVDEKKNALFLKGAIPGPKNGFVFIEKIGKVKNFIPYKIEAEKVADQNTDTGNIPNSGEATEKDSKSTEILTTKKLQTEENKQDEANNESNELNDTKVREENAN